MTLHGNALENGLSNDYSQNAGCNLEKVHGIFATVELVVCVRGLAELHEAQFRTEDLANAETHPLAQETACIRGLLLILEDDLDLLVKIEALELTITGHEDVLSVDLQVFGLAFSPGDALLFQF
jgi:hypothetical protein